MTRTAEAVELDLRRECEWLERFAKRVGGTGLGEAGVLVAEVGMVAEGFWELERGRGWLRLGL